MKPTILSIMMPLLGASIPIAAQDSFYGPSVQLASQEDSIISSKLSAYYAFSIYTKALNKVVKEQGATNIDIQLTLGSAFYFDLSLEENEIRAENYTEVFQTAQGRQIFKGGPCNTYQGYLNGDTTQEVRLYISDDLFGGYITVGDSILHIEPSKEFISDGGGA